MGYNPLLSGSQWSHYPSTVDPAFLSSVSASSHYASEPQRRRRIEMVCDGGKAGYQRTLAMLTSFGFHSSLSCQTDCTKLGDTTSAIDLFPLRLIGPASRNRRLETIPHICDRASALTPPFARFSEHAQRVGRIHLFSQPLSPDSPRSPWMPTNRAGVQLSQKVLTSRSFG